MHIKQIKKSYDKKDQSMYGSDKIKDLLGLLYHENSKLDPYTARQQGESIGYFSDPYIVERSTKPHKMFFGLERFPFEGYLGSQEDDPFLKLITARRSARVFDRNYKISLTELEALLY